MPTASVTVTRAGDRFVCRSPFELRHVAKQAGFRWDPAAKQWYTEQLHVAAKLAPYADDTCRAELEEAEANAAAAVRASRAAALDVELPVPEELAYLPFQRAGIAAGISRTNLLLGDEMGLGKTIQAIGIYNADPTLYTVLIICPASLRLNWQREWRKWSVRDRQAAIATTAGLPSTNVVIVNYDIAARLQHELRRRTWDLIIADEAHYLKNRRAARTQAILGKWDRDPTRRLEPIEAERKVFLTGTPIPNRPIEGHALFAALCPERFGNLMRYAKRYCGAFEGRYGWDMSGATNLEELQRELRETILIRRLKADVLTELPPKRRAVIELPAEGAIEEIEAEREAWERHEEVALALRTAVELAKASADPADYEQAVERLRDQQRAAFTELSRLRHAVALAKVPYVVAHLETILEEPGQKLVCFGHHRDVIAQLAKPFGAAAVTLTGETPLLERQAAVDRFQKDPECRLFVGSITAAGVGLTLTASAHVVFAELDWVPGNMTQAEDRCHRIGQRDSVLVQHLVLEGSLDARMARVLVEKQEVIAAALDDEIVAAEPIAPIDLPATTSVTQQRLAAAAAALTPEQIAEIHSQLHFLAARCDGAAEEDGQGFNKLDTRIGKSLAAEMELTPRQAALGAQIIRKYRRQLAAWAAMREVA